MLVEMYLVLCMVFNYVKDEFIIGGIGGMKVREVMLIVYFFKVF